jgi:murein DD-endopeptidase MepM/ murein hydrolase activator NlpD
MDRYSIIVVAEETAPVRRFEIRKDFVKRGIWGAGMACVLLALCLGDYIRVRASTGELKELRVEVASQQDQIESLDETLSRVRSKLDSIREFERKVRIIANLPGSAGIGGEEIVEVGVDNVGVEGPLDSNAEALPGQGQPLGLSPEEGRSAEQNATSDDSRLGARPSGMGGGDEPRLEAMHREFLKLGERASFRESSLAMLADQLEGKRHHLASTPAIWPTKGWLTSRFGSRTSPFTNRKQFHAGIDIAGQRGTDVVAPARGKVVFSGERGPLGKSVIIDHGFGIRTHYGHSDELFVSNGDLVERGQRIAALGNSGRSTGPHLHYVVEVAGKATDPLDYIFD